MTRMRTDKNKSVKIRPISVIHVRFRLISKT